MKTDIPDIINFIAIFQLSVFVFFLIRKKSNRQSNRILAVFLISQIMILINLECFRYYELVFRYAPVLFYSGSSFYYLAAPVFYLYVKSLAYRDFVITRKHFLHAVPFLLSVLLLFFTYHIHSPEKQREILQEGLFSYSFWVAFNLSFFLQLLIYFIADLRILRSYRKELKEEYSSVKDINLYWVTYILYGFILAWLSSVIVLLSQNYFSNILTELMLLNLLAFFIFFNFIFYKGLSQPEIFSGVEEKPKYLSSRLSESDAETYLRKLEKFMEEEKPFLNPELTLKDLALQLSIQPRYLSQIINEHKSQNFYDYISQYRIEESKRLLSEKSSGKTVLEVLYQAGFNSKSSFNTAFKKFTGITPSQFKRKIKTAA